MTKNNEPSKSCARTTAPEGSIDIHEYIDGKNFVPEPNIKTEVGQKGVIRATCISKRKGTRKEPIPEGVEVVAHFGVKNDAHASSDWHRQVSLLAWESIERAQAMGLDVKEGDFAENFCTEGIDVMHMPMGTQVKIGEDVIIEISQIGKVCHTRCAIYYLAGDCIFPREGIFGRRAPRRHSQARRHPRSAESRRRNLRVLPRRRHRRSRRSAPQRNALTTNVRRPP